MTTLNASSMTKPRHRKDRCRIELWRTRHPKRQILLELLEARILRAVDVGVNAPDAVDEGETLTLDGWYTSGDGASSAPTLTVSWGDGVTDSYSLAENTSACVAYAVDHIYADDGSYAVAVTLYDDTGSDSDWTSVIVGDSFVPSLTFSLSDSDLTVGETVNLTGNYTLPGVSESVSLQIDWGDDTTDTVSGSPDGSFAHGHAYADDGSYGVTATATYSNGGSATNSDSVVVTGQASETWSLSCTLSDTTAEVSQSVSMICDFGQTGNSESVTLQIDWGDGTTHTSSGTLDEIFNDTHAYSSEGSYDITVTATDNNGGPPEETFVMLVAQMNQPPEVSISRENPYEVDENAILTLSGTGISVSDPDAGDGDVLVTLQVGEGTVFASPGSTGVDVPDSNSSSVQLTGTIAEINNLLAGNATGWVYYQNSLDAPQANTTLTVTINDQGNTGLGGALTASAGIQINVEAVNDPPEAENFHSG